MDTCYSRHLFIKLQLCSIAASPIFYCLGRVFNSLQRGSNLTSSLSPLTLMQLRRLFYSAITTVWKPALQRVRYSLCACLLGLFCVFPVDPAQKKKNPTNTQVIKQQTRTSDKLYLQCSCLYHASHTCATFL